MPSKLIGRAKGNDDGGKNDVGRERARKTVTREFDTNGDLPHLQINDPCLDTRNSEWKRRSFALLSYSLMCWEQCNITILFLPKTVDGSIFNAQWLPFRGSPDRAPFITTRVPLLIGSTYLVGCLGYTCTLAYPYDRTTWI